MHNIFHQSFGFQSDQGREILNLVKKMLLKNPILVSNSLALIVNISSDLEKCCCEEGGADFW